jgi:hypothetical protein
MGGHRLMDGRRLMVRAGLVGGAAAAGTRAGRAGGPMIISTCA